MGYDNKSVRTTRTYAYEGNDLPTLLQTAALDLAGVPDSDDPVAAHATLEGTTRGMWTFEITL
jgi:hypothetical protein